MTIRGSVAYPITAATTELFAAPGAVLTLINEGPDDAYLSTRDGADTSGSIILHVNASVPWDADKPCFGRTLTGSATIRATDNSGVITDPSAIASAILDQGLALAIANAIITNGLPQLIAQFIASTPPQAEHVVQLCQVNHAVGVANTFGDFDTFYVDGVQNVYPALFTADPLLGFRVMKSMASFYNPTAADIRVSYFCQRDVTHPLHTMALHTVNVPAGGTTELVIDYDGATTDSFVLGGTGAFIPKWGLFASAAGVIADISYLCATFAGAPAPVGPNPPPALPTFIGSNFTTWPQAGAPPPASFINLPAVTAPGDLVVVAMTFAFDEIDHVSGLGVNPWGRLSSREPGGNFVAAQIYYCEVVTAGTTITINKLAGFGIDPGYAVAYHFRGIDPVLAASVTQSASTGVSIRQTPPLNAEIGQVYIGCSIERGAAAPSAISEQPGAFDATADVDPAGTGQSRFDGGYRIARSSETIARTCTFAGGHEGIAIAAVFGTPI